MTNWNPQDTPNFNASEMACKCGCGQSDMDASFMIRLQRLRDEFGPMIITSAFRCKNHNDAIGGGPEHPLGKAADIAVDRQKARRMLTLAVMDFPRIGVKQRGEGRFLHLGTADPSEVNGASPTIWSY